MRHKKQPPKKTFISCEWHSLNYSNLQRLLPRVIAWDTENFIHIFGRKQKLQLSKVKFDFTTEHSLNHNCYTKNANKTNYMEFIWNDKCPLNLLDLIPLDCHVWTAMLEIYQCYTAKSTVTYGCEDRSPSDLSWLASRPNLMQQYCCSAQGSRHAKSSCWTFRICCRIDVTSITCHVSLQ